MSKFGDLISGNVPVLLHFASDHNPEDQNMQTIMEEVALEMGDKLSIIRIDVLKNPDLVEALRIKTTPTLMVYKNGAMVWRQSGITDQKSLIIIAKAFN